MMSRLAVVDISAPAQKKGASPPFFARHAGFTLVELVAVIILISILAAVAYPRISGTSGYDEIVVRDQLVSAVRFAQQRAMYDNAANHCYRIVITASGFSVQRSTDNGSNFSAVNEAALDIGDAEVSAAFSNVSATPLTLPFDSLGSPRSGAGCGNAMASTQTVAVTGATTASLRIYSTGYVQTF